MLVIKETPFLFFFLLRQNTELTFIQRKCIIVLSTRFPVDFLPSCRFQGAMAGWVAGLGLSFWVGIGSIVTRSASAKPLLLSCTANPLSHNTTVVIWTALGNVTQRYPADSRVFSILTAVTTLINHLSLLLSRPSGLKRFYSLSYMWYSAFSCFTVILVGLAISFLTGR